MTGDTTTGRSATPDVDVERLRRLLAASVAGPVSFDAGTRALYASDASIYRRPPLAVVVPRTVDDVVAAVAACAEVGAPVVPRGGGTSIAGQACGGGGVVLDTTPHLNRVLEVDPDRRTARVEPGVVLDVLRAAAAPHGLTFGPDPSTHSRCTLGGMIGNNSCGAHSIAWGTTADNVERLDVLLPDGTRMDVGAGGHPDRPGREGAVYRALADLAERHRALLRQRLTGFPRQVSGYGLHRLLPENGFHVARSLVGTEGTCVTVLGATVRLVQTPAARVLLVLGYPDLYAAADAAPGLLSYGPLAIEGIDDQLVANVRRRTVELPEGGGWLLVEVGGETVAEAEARARTLVATLPTVPRRPSFRVVTAPTEQRALWRIREEGAGLATRLPDGTEAWPGWEDAAVPPERLGSYLRQFRALLDRHGRTGALYGHFGEGCIHIRIDFDMLSREGIAGFRHFIEDAADLVVAHGGSLSGEHGDGQARGELLPRMFGTDVVGVFEEFKAIWDPDNRMNPGMVVHPARLDEDLRVGPPAGREPLTVFAYTHDAGSFAQATRRCVGVGKCRQHTGGVMCPSYQVTRDERHSTRGRARLLGEMLRGDLVTGGWRSTEVRDALDLCLACKGCASDCPVNVDMATYKAEFLHHHYARRLRPRSHYSMGWLPVWARLAGRAPRLVNATGRAPGVSRAVKWLAGVAPQRDLPAFAAEPFTRWFARRPTTGPAGDSGADAPAVLLWPDTFTNYLDPDVGRAATEVLEAAGFRVLLPPAGVCCGLTWISTGQLGIARRVLRRTLRVLRPFLDAGVPVVGLEPSCTAALRGDLTELLPGDDAAAALAMRTVTLADLLTRHGWQPPTLAGTAITQTHCHQHAVLGTAPDERLLAAAGLDNQPLDSGCCGLAGNFGFERGHYDVSMACAERVLLPAVRAAGPDTRVLADGFSCRTQIAHGSDRRAVHLAQVLRDALGQRGGCT